MKRTLSLLFALMLSLAVNAQTIFEQTFDGSSLPSGWSFGGEGKNSMLINASNFAGGTPNEAACAGSMQSLPDFNGAARVISPAYDITGISELTFIFKQIYLFYTSYKVAIAVSDDNGSTWTDLWSQNYNGEGTTEVRQILSIPDDMNKSSVKFCVYVYGNSANLWCVDDIMAMVQKDNDLALTSINTSDVIGLGENTASFTAINYGNSAVTTFVAQYQFEGYEEVSQTFSTYMAPFASKNFSFNVPTNIQGLDPITLAINIISVNNTDDENTDNNSLEKELTVAMGSAQRIPMIEHFSSSSCPPCVSVNTSMKTLTNNNPGKYTYTKYSTNWPSPQDAHYTAECGTRANYYGVSGVPSIFLDGMDFGAPITQSELTERYNTAAFADIRGAFSIDGTTINVIADFMSYSELNNVRAFITVNEKVIEKNGANGEKEFRHIMLKMLTGTSGKTLNIKAGEYQRVEASYNMSSLGSKLQDINDLEVSLWLQDYSTAEVFNSHYAYGYTSHCYPVRDLQLKSSGSDLNITWSAPEQGTPTGYNVYNNGTLVAENTTNLSLTIAEGPVNVISVVALYEDGKTSVPVAVLGGTTVGVEEQAEANSFNIYR